MVAHWIEFLKRLSESEPENPQYRFLLGDYLLEDGQTDAAEFHFQQAISSDPHPLSVAGLARVYFVKGQYQNCLDVLVRLMDSGMEDLNVKLLAARCWIRMECWEPACQLYKELLQKHPLLTDEELDLRLAGICL
jgi:tetratricopeptide (TPR) repeat protein